MQPCRESDEADPEAVQIDPGRASILSSDSRVGSRLVAVQREVIVFLIISVATDVVWVQEQTGSRSHAESIIRSSH